MAQSAQYKYDLAKTNHELAVLPDYLQPVAGGVLERDQRDFYSTFARDYPPHAVRRPDAVKRSENESHLPFAFEEPTDYTSATKATYVEWNTHLDPAQDRIDMQVSSVPIDTKRLAPDHYLSEAKKNFKWHPHAARTKAEVDLISSHLPLEHAGASPGDHYRSTAKSTFVPHRNVAQRAPVPDLYRSNLPFGLQPGDVRQYVPTSTEAYQYRPAAPDRPVIQWNTSEVPLDHKAPVPKSTFQESYVRPGPQGRRGAARSTDEDHVVNVPWGGELLEKESAAREAYRPHARGERAEVPSHKDESNVVLAGGEGGPYQSTAQAAFQDPCVVPPPTVGSTRSDRNRSQLPFDEGKRQFETTSGAAFVDHRPPRPEIVKPRQVGTDIPDWAHPNDYRTTNRDEFIDRGRAKREKAPIDLNQAYLPFAGPGLPGDFATTYNQQHDYKPIDPHNRHKPEVDLQESHLPLDEGPGNYETTYQAHMRRRGPVEAGRRGVDIRAESNLPLARGFYLSNQVKRTDFVDGVERNTVQGVTDRLVEELAGTHRSPNPPLPPPPDATGSGVSAVRQLRRTPSR